MTTETILTGDQIDEILMSHGVAYTDINVGICRTIEQAVLQSQRGRKESKHPDDAAVDEFAAAMKSKLAKKRAEGRGGWQDMSATELSELLHEHVEKGDPLDVANLAMMLHQNGQPILQSPEIQALRKDAEMLDWLYATNLPFRMGWDVRRAPAGNVVVGTVIQLGGVPTPLRAAIEAAMEKQP